MRLVPLRDHKQRSTGVLRSLRSTGWRRTGVWFVLAASVAGIVLLCCFVVGIAWPESSLQRGTVIFRGSCDYSRRLNVGLHLLINLVASIVLASSNYFMQILNAPSRHEIERAHRTLSSMEIGIPSLKNLSFLSNFKRCFWAMLLISSLPIHVFFNSSIYETAFAGSSWQLTIAAESFAQGSPFYPPGASLAPAGSPSPIDYESAYGETTYHLPDSKGPYGEHTNLADYWNASSSIRQKLDQVARDAGKAEGDHRWERLSSRDCREGYSYLKPRETYGDVVVVVEAGMNNTGWTRAEVYADPQGKLPDWTDRIPRDELNTLWYSTECIYEEYPDFDMSKGYKGSLAPNAPCAKALGYYRIALSGGSFEDRGDWSIAFKNLHGTAEDLEASAGYDNNFSSLSVKYCLADPTPGRSCKVILSNYLILVVMPCILFKIITCTVVIGLLPAESLVTPGDALNSFLSEPDHATRGLSTGDVHDFHRLEYSLPCPLANTCEEYGLLSTLQLARAWRQKRRRIISVMPRSAWWHAYAPILTFLSILTYVTIMSFRQNKYSFGKAFGGWGPPPPLWYYSHFLRGIIVANIGQLILSWCYFAYNSLLTRIHVEKELNLYGLSYKPLRVSFPKGEQVDTWRLQLPYKISIPLLLISILLHWLTSNAFFVIAKEGDYGLAEDSIVAVGYSPIAIFTILILGVALASIPFLVSLYTLPGDMIAGGSNSLVLSAACHAVCPNRCLRGGANRDAARTAASASSASSVSSAAVDTDDESLGQVGDQRTIEEEAHPNRHHHDTAPQSSMSELEEGPLQEDDALVKLAQSKLRWGVTALTTELHDIVQETGQEALHLTFATEETFIAPPSEGELYL
ncbi:hypothetical protein PG997_001662 [Apiospora hydei]|uniref:DUF6536 domain-containing protein n=1 Tax=Apiospora hydei TaxID=1337664 RepID=A0ABR1XE61_9PEZI